MKEGDDRRLMWVDDRSGATEPEPVSEEELLAVARSLVDPRPPIPWEEVEATLKKALTEAEPRSRIRRALVVLRDTGREPLDRVLEATDILDKRARTKRALDQILRDPEGWEQSGFKVTDGRERFPDLFEEDEE